MIPVKRAICALFVTSMLSWSAMAQDEAWLAPVFTNTGIIHGYRHVPGETGSLTRLFGSYIGTPPNEISIIQASPTNAKVLWNGQPATKIPVNNIPGTNETGMWLSDGGLLTVSGDLTNASVHIEIVSGTTTSTFAVLKMATVWHAIVGGELSKKSDLSQDSVWSRSSTNALFQRAESSALSATFASELKRANNWPVVVFETRVGSILAANLGEHLAKFYSYPYKGDETNQPGCSGLLFYHGESDGLIGRQSGDLGFALTNDPYVANGVDAQGQPNARVFYAQTIYSNVLAKWWKAIEGNGTDPRTLKIVLPQLPSRNSKSILHQDFVKSLLTNAPPCYTWTPSDRSTWSAVRFAQFDIARVLEWEYCKDYTDPASTPLSLSLGFVTSSVPRCAILGTEFGSVKDVDFAMKVGKQAALAASMMTTKLPIQRDAGRPSAPTLFNAGEWVVVPWVSQQGGSTNILQGVGSYAESKAIVVTREIDEVCTNIIVYIATNETGDVVTNEVPSGSEYERTNVTSKTYHIVKDETLGLGDINSVTMTNFRFIRVGSDEALPKMPKRMHHADYPIPAFDIPESSFKAAVFKEP